MTDTMYIFAKFAEFAVHSNTEHLQRDIYVGYVFQDENITVPTQADEIEINE